MNTKKLLFIPLALTLGACHSTAASLKLSPVEDLSTNSQTIPHLFLSELQKSLQESSATNRSILSMASPPSSLSDVERFESLLTQEQKTNNSEVIKWAKTHPKQLASLQKIKISKKFNSEEAILNDIILIQKSLPEEYSPEETDNLNKQIERFDSFVKKNAPQPPSSNKRILSAFDFMAGAPYVYNGYPYLLNNTDNKAIDTYKKYYAGQSLDSFYVPELHQIGPDCAMASWAFSKSSKWGYSSPLCNDYYQRLRSKYYNWPSTSWNPLQYALGVVPDDLYKWMNIEFPGRTKQSYNTDILTLLGQVQNQERPVVLFSNDRTDVNKGAHYACMIGYDSKWVVLNNSAPGNGVKTIYLDRKQFIQAWQMKSVRDALSGYAWLATATFQKDKLNRILQTTYNAVLTIK